MDTILEKLTKTKLNSSTIIEVEALINSFGQVAFMTTDYFPAKLIERAVPNSEKEPVFNKLSRISFKPQQYNTTFQRASTPTNTMFYAAVIPELKDETELKHARIIGASESVEFLRDKSKDGEASVTFGQWQLKEPLALLTVVDPSQTYKLAYLRALVNSYNENLGKVDPALAQKTREYLKFLSSEFSKPVPEGMDHNYMISSIFTEVMLKSNPNMDGVLYPSVQFGGEGLCLAIHPKSVSKIELINVLQCRITKVQKEVKLENIRFCKVDPPNSDFQLKDLPS